MPAEVTVKLLQKAMEESENDKFLIDGFPRNEENRAIFESVVCYSKRCAILCFVVSYLQIHVFYALECFINFCCLKFLDPLRCYILHFHAYLEKPDCPRCN